MTEYAHSLPPTPIPRTCRRCSTSWRTRASNWPSSAPHPTRTPSNGHAAKRISSRRLHWNVCDFEWGEGLRAALLRGLRGRGRCAHRARLRRAGAAKPQRVSARLRTHLQARAFRRLAGKTQVFTSRASDHFRSRLTHTIEVAQIARGVAQELGLNQELAEALALVHDIGHPPFGHAGERALDQCLKRHGLRFDHNLHALRIVEHFELRYAAHRGLNLTLGVREGIIKHSRDYSAGEYPELAGYLLDRQPPLEAQIIDLADEIAYLTADLDDGVESGLLEIDHIREHVDLLAQSYAQVEREHAGVEAKYLFNEALQRMQNILTDDLMATTLANSRAIGATSLDEVRAPPRGWPTFPRWRRRSANRRSATSTRRCIPATRSRWSMTRPSRW